MYVCLERSGLLYIVSGVFHVLLCLVECLRLDEVDRLVDGARVLNRPPEKKTTFRIYKIIFTNIEYTG